MSWIGVATLALIAMAFPCMVYDWANGYRTELTFWYCMAGIGIGLAVTLLGAVMGAIQ